MNSKQQKRATIAFRLFLAAALGIHPIPVARAGTTITVDTTDDELNSNERRSR
ncbi:MAG: hypothetical protein WBW48_03350 [Anaerolineae bacterium]